MEDILFNIDYNNPNLKKNHTIPHSFVVIYSKLHKGRNRKVIKA